MLENFRANGLKVVRKVDSVRAHELTRNIVLSYAKRLVRAARTYTIEAWAV